MMLQSEEKALHRCPSEMYATPKGLLIEVERQQASGLWYSR